MARSGGRPTVEDSLNLDIRDLIRAGLGPGWSRSGILQWPGPNSSRLVCRSEYNTWIAMEVGNLHLTNITGFDRFGNPVRLGDQIIQLVTTTPPYGGQRWWFVCPDTGRRAMKLYLPAGERIFASRQAHRLGYTVQREDAGAQARRRARKARARIGGSPSLMERLPIKPKWMRWKTYWQHMDTCRKADGQVLGLLTVNAEKTLGRTLT